MRANHITLCLPAQRFYYMWFCGSLDENHKRIEGLWMTLKKK